MAMDGTGGSHLNATTKNLDFLQGFFITVARICDKPLYRRTFIEQAQVLAWYIYTLLFVPAYILPIKGLRRRIDNNLTLYDELLTHFYATDDALLFDYDAYGNVTSSYMHELIATGDYDLNEAKDLALLEQIETTLHLRGAATRERIFSNRTTLSNIQEMLEDSDEQKAIEDDEELFVQ